MVKFIKFGPCYFLTNLISRLEITYCVRTFKQLSNKKIHELTDNEFRELPIWSLEIHFNNRNCFLLNEKKLTFKECEALAESFVKSLVSDDLLIRRY